MSHGWYARAALATPQATRAETASVALAAAAAAAFALTAAGLPPAAWRAAALASLLGGAWAVLSARSGAAPRWLDGPRLLLLAVLLWSLGHVYASIGGDGYEYYALLRSPLLDLDFDFANDFAGLGVPPVRSTRGEVTVRVAMGVSLFWLPFFLAAHVLALVLRLLGGGAAADGFSPLYQAAVTTGTFVYAAAAVVLIEGMLRARAGRGVALLAALACWLATPLHFYATANAFMSHGVSVFAAAAMAALWLRARGSEARRPWALVGIFGGLLAVVRPQDAVLLAVPGLDLLLRRPLPAPALLALAAGPAALGLAQLGLWFAFYGPAFLVVVREMNWVAGTTPQVVDFLFAARHGLFTWTPLFAVAVLGWLALLRRDGRLVALCVTAFALAVLVNSSTTDWWGSDAFGQRRMLSFLPLFALGLGAALAWLAARPLLPLAALVAALAAWTLGFEGIYNAQVVAGKGQAVDLDRLTAAQMRALHRGLVRWHGRLPARAWVLLHDNLNGVWLDEGSRSLRGTIDLGREPEDLPLVVGHGWYDATREGEVDLRLSRGFRSWLRVPLRTPGPLQMTLRARRGVPELPVRARVEVNTRPAGEVDLTAEWADHVVAIPEEALRRGLNDVALVFSATPRRDIPGYHGRDAAAAVDRVSFRRVP